MNGKWHYRLAAPRGSGWVAWCNSCGWFYSSNVADLADRTGLPIWQSPEFAQDWLDRVHSQHAPAVGVVIPVEVL